MRAVATAIAIGAANENVAEELHFYFFEAGATAALTLALGGVEAEGAGVESALFGRLGLSEQLTDVIERADINGRIGAWGSAAAGLIDQYYLVQMLGPAQ